MGQYVFRNTSETHLTCFEWHVERWEVKGHVGHFCATEAHKKREIKVQICHGLRLWKVRSSMWGNDPEGAKEKALKKTMLLIFLGGKSGISTCSALSFDHLIIICGPLNPPSSSKCHQKEQRRRSVCNVWELLLTWRIALFIPPPPSNHQHQSKTEYHQGEVRGERIPG